MPTTDPLIDRRCLALSAQLDFAGLPSPDPDAVPVLGPRDYSRLKTLAHSLFRTGDPLGRALADKLGACRVLRPDSIPPSVVVLGAQVTFAAEDSVWESHILAMPEDHRKDGRTLSVLTPLGTALLGAAAGQWVETTERDGRRLALHLLMVEQRPTGMLTPDGAPTDGTGEAATRCTRTSGMRKENTRDRKN